MEVWEILKISQEDYNTALFEAGCITAENFYSPADAIKIKHQAGYWKWLREQRKIVDAICIQHINKGRLVPGKKLFTTYYEMLYSHLERVYPPKRLENNFGRYKVLYLPISSMS